MAILSVVGRRSPIMRVTIALLYVILSAGAVTMVYPFLLMLSTSVTSKVDVEEYRVIPRYFYDDDVLFAKYLEEKFARPELLNDAYGQDIYKFPELLPVIGRHREESSKIPAEARAARLKDWREFFKTLPLQYKSAAFLSAPGCTGSTHIQYCDFVERKFSGDLKRCNEAYQDEAARFRAIEIYNERQLARDYVPEDTAKYRDFVEFKQALPDAALTVAALDWKYASFLKTKFDTIDRLNERFGTRYADFAEVHAPESIPAAESPERELWVEFVRGRLPPAFIGVAGGAARFDAYLATRVGPASLPAGTEAGPTVWEREARPGVDRVNVTAMAGSMASFYEYIKRVEDPANIRVLSTENLYAAFLAARYKTIAALNQAHAAAYTDFSRARPPLIDADWEDAHARGAGLRWHYLTRNYIEVIGYILLHGRALWNTFVLVALTMLSSLTVNPLAAYALSRFQLSYTNKILLFCLATMAFPPEVGMIPSFLMLRSFPLAQLVVGLAMGGLIFAIYCLALRKRAPLWIGLVLALAAGIAASQSLPGEAGRVTLLNSYSALILPGIANGFAIFMFKGFFDSLPRELYEAAAIEGATELRMFWQITVPLCAPVIAVIGLGTFTAAYGSFMFALLVCQKEEMWTLMVWIYEMQQWAPNYVMIAALTLAALPLLLVVLLCQRVILRGIVLPSMH